MNEMPTLETARLTIRPFKMEDLRHGYASEAAQALIDYAFQELRLKRIVATTSYDNIGSMGVMRKLGMRVEENLLGEPPWLQVVGVLENRSCFH